MRRLLPALLVVLCGRAWAVTPPSSGCPPMTNANLFVSWSDTYESCSQLGGACSPGVPVTFEVRPFAYSFDCAPHTFTWDFGDGNVAFGRKVVHGFVTSGIHEVKVRVQRSDALVTLNERVEVGHPYLTPLELFADPHMVDFVPVPQTFRFTVFPAIDSEWEWNFGDGTAARGAETVRVHTFARPGKYIVRLRNVPTGRELTTIVTVNPSPRRRPSRR